MYGICPICDKFTVTHPDSPICDYFGITKCETCPYELRQNGSYATTSVVDGERFSCEDGYGDEKKLAVKVKEMRVALGYPENPPPFSVLRERMKERDRKMIEGIKKYLEDHPTDKIQSLDRPESPPSPDDAASSP